MRKSKQDYAGVDNRKRILDTATDLFIKQGAQDTSLADIARALGISKGTLYYYYTTRADLIFDVTDAYMQELTQGLLQWVKTLDRKIPPESILETVFKTFFNAQTRGKLHVYLIHEAITHNKTLAGKIQMAYRNWKEMLREGLEVVFDDSIDTQIYADIILTMITGGIIHTILDVEMSPLEEMVKPLLYK